MEILSSIWEVLVLIFGHEYWLAVYGVIAGAVTDYSWNRNKSGNKLTFKQWRHDYKDDFLRDMVWVPLVVIFDDELLGAWNKTGLYTIAEVGPFFYFVTGFSIDRIISLLSGKK